VSFVVDLFRECDSEAETEEGEDVEEGFGRGIVDVGRGRTVDCLAEGGNLEEVERLEGHMKVPRSDMHSSSAVWSTGKRGAVGRA
jgi:hypothetical protein